MPVPARGNHRHGPEPATLLLAPLVVGVLEQAGMVNGNEGNKYLHVACWLHAALQGRARQLVLQFLRNNHPLPLCRNCSCCGICLFGNQVKLSGSTKH